MRYWVLSLLVFGSLVSVTTAMAAMSSSHYEINADYIGVGGGVSTSTGYSLSDAVSNLSVGIVSSTTYEVQGGFVSNDSGLISLSLSTGSVDLGTLSSGAVKTGAVVATVTTDQATGFTLSIGGVSGTSPAEVSDGSVTAGSSEYGLATSGTYSATSGDSPISAGLILASSNVPVTSEATTLTFKASIAAAAAAATYNQSISLAASTNF